MKKNIILFLILSFGMLNIYKKEEKLEQKELVTTQIRLIKKYRNRKLYDTELSKYITLDQIGGYIDNNVKFQVIENYSKKNITRDIVIETLPNKLKNSNLNTGQLLELVRRFQ